MDLFKLLIILFLIFYVLNLILAAFIVFMERHEASSTWAWVMGLFLFPVVGFVAYLIFGQKLTSRKLFQWPGKNKAGIKQQISSQIDAIKNETFSFKDSTTQEYYDLIFMHLVYGQSVLTQHNHVKVYTDGKEKFESLINQLEKAEDHIHLLYYTIKADNLGHQLMDILVRKAQEGVKVRFLYDYMGSRGIKKDFFNQLKEAGGEIKTFFPSFIRLNFRNHRKLAIIDGNTGFIGGFNIGDEYLGLNKKIGYWRDSHLKIMGETVQAMQIRFILDWNQDAHKKIMYEDQYFPEVAPKGNVGVQIVSSGPAAEWEQIKNGFLKMIVSSKKSLYIQTPYFIPDDTLFDAIKVASLSGVDVRIMIPNKPDHLFVYWATLSAIGKLLEVGVKVHIYQEGFMHAKTIVVDGKIATVGTANMDVRSFRLNFEVNAFLYNETLAEELIAVFEQDVLDSTELTLTKYNNRSRLVRFKEAISRLVAPLL